MLHMRTHSKILFVAAVLLPGGLLLLLAPLVKMLWRQVSQTQVKLAGVVDAGVGR